MPVRLSPVLGTSGFSPMPGSYILMAMKSQFVVTPPLKPRTITINFAAEKIDVTCVPVL